MSSNPSLRPDATLGRNEKMNDAASSASIKSGVIGFPQGGEQQHAALKLHDDAFNVDHSSAQAQGGSGLPDRTRTGNREQQHDASNYGRDAALGAGSVGTGAALARGLHHQKDHDNLRAQQQSTSGTANPDFRQPAAKNFSQPFDASHQEPVVITDTDRAFPLAGGVTSRKHDSQTHEFSTNERNPGTKDRDVGVHDSHGREGLAGAAAAAVTTGAVSHSRPSHERLEDTRNVGETVGSPVTSSNILRSEHELRSGHQHGQERGTHGREALAGATAAGLTAGAVSHSQPGQDSRNVGETRGATATSSELRSGPKHDEREAMAGATAAWNASAIKDPRIDHVGEVPAYQGDPCAPDDKPSSTAQFTAGPHKTDTANRLDPHMHIPGEFPETPLETPGDRRLESGDYLSTQRLSERRSIENPSGSTAPTGSQLNSQSQSNDHHGRNVAGIGALGLGAAGVGAYEAGKHHERDSADIEGDMAHNPYSAAQIDPRVNSKPAVEEQKLPRQSEHGIFPTSQYDTAHNTSQPQSEPHGVEQGIIPTSQYETPQHTSQLQKEPEQKDHHYGRDAGLVGTGAAAAGGLYYLNQRDEKPASGPASATIGPHDSNVANVLDPRVQPDPALQRHHQAGSTAEDPATKTVGPHKSNIANVVDPRVLPQPEKQKGHTTTGPHQSDTLNRLDPKVDSKAQSENTSHLGRDAAAATAVADFGADKAVDDYNEHRNTHPITAMEDQRYDPSAPGAHDPTETLPVVGAHDPIDTTQHHYGRDAALGAGAGGLAYGALRKDESSLPTSTQQVPTSQSSSSRGLPVIGAHDPIDTSQHHYGRDAALGSGAGGLAYGALKKDNESSLLTSTQQVPTSQAGAFQQHPTSQTSGRPTVTHEPSYDPFRPVENSPTHHYGRDALLGAAGLGAGTGLYTASKQHDDNAQPQSTQEYVHPGYDSVKELHPYVQAGHDSVQAPTQQRQVQEEEKHVKHPAALAGGAAGLAGAGAYAYGQHDPKEVEKERIAQLKANEKKLEHQHKEEQKDFAHQQKEQQKLAEKKEKAHEKELEHQQKTLEKQHAEREGEHEGEKKKHHFFGFLHHKDKKAKESPEHSPRASKEYAGSDATDGSDGRHKLHKDPPKGHPAWEALDAKKNEQPGVDGSSADQPGQGYGNQGAGNVSYGDETFGTGAPGNTTTGHQDQSHIIHGSNPYNDNEFANMR